MSEIENKADELGRQIGRRMLELVRTPVTEAIEAIRATDALAAALVEAVQAAITSTQAERIKELERQRIEVAGLLGFDDAGSLDEKLLAACIKQELIDWRDAKENQSTRPLPEGAVVERGVTYVPMLDAGEPVVRNPIRGEFFLALRSRNEHPLIQKRTGYWIDNDPRPIYVPWSASSGTEGEWPVNMVEARGRIEALKSAIETLKTHAFMIARERDSLRQQLAAVTVKPGDVVLRKVGDGLKAMKGQAWRDVDAVDGRTYFGFARRDHGAPVTTVYDVIEVPSVPATEGEAGDQPRLDGKYFVWHDSVRTNDSNTPERDSLRQQLAAVTVKPGDVVLRKVGENLWPKKGQVYASGGNMTKATVDHLVPQKVVYDVIEVPSVPATEGEADDTPEPAQHELAPIGTMVRCEQLQEKNNRYWEVLAKAHGAIVFRSFKDAREIVAAIDAALSPTEKQEPTQ